jgi:BASS family bile acid:Na+ symporter
MATLMGIGQRLELSDALRRLRDLRFVALTLLWGFLLVSALGHGVAYAMPLDAPSALGLILTGLAPCAPFVSALAAKGHGDLGSSAAFMLLTAVGAVIVMSRAVPLLATGLAVTAWAVARPLLVTMLVAIKISMANRRTSVARAAAMQPRVRKVTGVATPVVAVLCVVIDGKGLHGLGGTFALASRCLSFGVAAALTYPPASGLRHEERIVLSIGLTTGHMGAALAPLPAVPEPDQHAAIMVVPGLPVMVAFAIPAVPPAFAVVRAVGVEPTLWSPRSGF